MPSSTILGSPMKVRLTFALPFRGFILTIWPSRDTSGPSTTTTLPFSMSTLEYPTVSLLYKVDNLHPVVNRQSVRFKQPERSWDLFSL